MKKIIFLFLVGTSLLSKASPQSGFQFTFGATSLPLDGVTASNSAKKDMLGELYNPIGFKYLFDSSSSYQFSANLSTTKLSLLSNKDKDKGTSSSLTQLGTDIIYSSSSDFNFKTHVGILLYELKGSGGTVELNNGDSTAVFTLPNRTSDSKMLYFGMGGQYNFGYFNLESTLNFLSLLSSTRRNYFLSLAIGVPL